MHVMSRALAVVFAGILFGVAAPAQTTGMPEPLRKVGIDQRLNEQAPLDLTFRDETGKQVQLRQYFGRKPVVLSLVYYECPMLCTMVLNGLLRSLRATPLNVHEHFEVVTVSFDPKEGPELAAPKKAEYVKKYGRKGGSEGWHFLTGEEASIRKLAQSVGFRYTWDAQTNQWAHASGIMVLTPQGKIARYLYGVEYSAKDLRFALVEASAGRILSPVDQLLLLCYHYDPKTGKYGFVIMNALRAAGMATVFLLGLFMFVNLRRDRRKI